MKKITIILITVLFTFGLAGIAFAFHGGGVAHCDGCHSMHQSSDNPIIGTANSRLLIGSDPSSTCLNCHNGAGGYHVNTAEEIDPADFGSNTNAGGDFYWITSGSQYSYSNWSGPVSNNPDNNGHNLVATDFGFAADPRPENAQAPGGSHSATLFGCDSCHDPHGQIAGPSGLGTEGGAVPITDSGSYGDPAPAAGLSLGNYRLLGDVGYTTANTTFSQPTPIARANGSNGASVAYGQNMSEWCSNCHYDYIVPDSSTGMHPSGNGVALGTFVANYNSYVATGNFTGGVGTAYDPLVAIERGEADSTLLDETSTLGADTNSNVMCLTCHRAHAGAFSNALRWDAETEFIGHAVAIAPTTTYADGSSPLTKAAYYADGAIVDITATYGEYQRSLCNKCHVQD